MHNDAERHLCSARFGTNGVRIMNPKDSLRQRIIEDGCDMHNDQNLGNRFRKSLMKLAEILGRTRRWLIESLRACLIMEG